MEKMWNKYKIFQPLLMFKVMTDWTNVIRINRKNKKINNKVNNNKQAVK